MANNRKKDPAAELRSYREELEKDIARWNDLRDNGGQDPFWPDGTNMNLVRNHIIVDLRHIAELEGRPDADVMSDERIPPQVDNDYMAPNQRYERPHVWADLARRNSKYAKHERSNDMPDDDMPDFIPRSEAEILARTLEIDEFQALSEYRCARDESPTPNAEGVYVGDLFSLRAKDGSCTFFQVMELNGEHGIIVRENAQMRQPYENGYYGVCRPVRDSFTSYELHALTTRRSQYWSYVFTKAPKSFGGACMTPCNDLQLFDYVVSEK